MKVQNFFDPLVLVSSSLGVTIYFQYAVSELFFHATAENQSQQTRQLEAGFLNTSGKATR